jgi:hypothetical protein
MIREIWYKIGMILTVATCLMTFVIFCCIGFAMVHIGHHGSLWGMTGSASSPIPN